RTNDHASRLQSDVDSMRAEIALLGRMICGVDENCVVRTSRHARFAANADRFVEVDDAVRSLEHGRGGTRGDTRSVRALIAARNLMGSAHLRKYSDVDVLNISPGDADRHDIFGLTRGGAGMATDAPAMVDNLSPLHAVASSCLLLDHLRG